MSSVGKYSKFIVSLAGTAVLGIDAQWPHATWVPWVTGLITAALTFLVPNATGTTKGGGS